MALLGSAGLGARAATWWLGFVASAALLAWLLGTPLAGGAVLALGLAALGLGARGWLAEVRAVDELDATLATPGREVNLTTRRPGAAGRLAMHAAALVRRAEEAEEAARSAHERTRDMLDAAPSGLVVTDATGRVEHVNAALRGMLALERDPVGLLPLEGLHAIELVHALAEAQQGGHAHVDDITLGDRDLSVSAHPMASGALAIVLDVSRERRVERARTDFVANVSHELRTPIAAILGFSETMLDTPDLAPDVAPMARAVHRNAQRLRQLFEDLLTLHQIEARRHEPPQEDVPLAPLLAEAVVPSVDAAAAKGIDFEVDVPEDLHAFVNPKALSAIIGNLVGNACKYTLDGGSVVVRAQTEGEEVRIDVTDTGLGIPRAHHARIFERFYRVDEGRAREVGGTGLGLAIVKHLAESAGCRVTLQSEEGRGSTFSVHVPRAARSKTPRTWDATLEPRTS